MIKTFAHKGIEAFFKNGTKAGIQAAHAARLARQLAQLNQAQAARDMNLPGWRLHPLSGGLDGHWAVSVGGNWRLTFRFDDGNAILVDYQDYH
ncbi:type II toxin-antitoxin system RelE/ParE family toxin [Limnohabitans lacus]|uniref:Type II toxin-antitoxin system RelE/ParE family toxin n=1 Tax=Limnohabitans lacus TaxID=3045173 RepID=A0ABT6XAU6_9BURK|nr:type II toxin-antitoxin system RelE/ParE family toxin [Limnohabitans sp. HM2-2]MDI9235201.1 type II toxin-antitoxin system RelE/ParE family toxin [Limnohabitans sp. HM2-2]